MRLRGAWHTVFPAFLPLSIAVIAISYGNLRAMERGPGGEDSHLPLEFLLELLAHLVAAATAPVVDEGVERRHRLAAGDDADHAVGGERLQLASPWRWRSARRARRWDCRRRSPAGPCPTAASAAHRPARPDSRRRRCGDRCRWTARRSPVLPLSFRIGAPFCTSWWTPGQAPAEEHVLLAAERRRRVVDDAQQLLDALGVLADRGRNAAHAEEALRALDGRFAAVEPRRDEDDRGRVVRIELAEVARASRCCGDRRPAIDIAAELAAEEAVLGLLNAHRAGVRVEDAGVVEPLHVLDRLLVLGRLDHVGQRAVRVLAARCAARGTCSGRTGGSTTARRRRRPSRPGRRCRACRGRPDPLW